MVDIAHRGRKFKIDGVSADDHLVKLLAKSGKFYEIDLLGYIEAIQDVLPPGVVVDVGANIGNHTVFLAEFVGRPVVAFEPNPDVLGLLERNLAVNGSKVEVVRKGLGAEPGRGTAVIDDAANAGNAHLDTSGGDLEITTMDAQLGGQRVALIKVDVEGMELQVLQGAVETLKKSQPHLFLEAATRKHFRELRDFLAPLGYRPIVRWAYTPVWHFAPNPSVGLRVRARWLRVTRWFR